MSGLSARGDGRAAAGVTRGRAILVAVGAGDSLWSTEESVAELAELARSAQLTVVGSFLQQRRAPDPRHYLGPGGLEELCDLASRLRADTIIADDELRPGQQRRLEEKTGLRVIDRTLLILDIFATRARSREGKLQVELARLTYLLPRLDTLWEAFSRPGGGIGTRGPGETQLEVDRRRIQQRMAELRACIDRVRRHRAGQRRRRRRLNWPLVALVGYTNAGKTTLLGALGDRDVEGDDRLFATLDPTVRRVPLPDGRNILLADTVGFVNKLPPALVAAFRATLEEITHADLILHVVDAANPRAPEQEQTVREILADLGADRRPILTVYNKLDRMAPGARAALQERLARPGAPGGGDGVAVSAITGEGLPSLLEAIAARLPGAARLVRLSLPYAAGGFVDLVHREGQVLEVAYGSDGIHLVARVPAFLAGRLRPWIRQEETRASQKATRR